MTGPEVGSDLPGREAGLGGDLEAARATAEQAWRVTRAALALLRAELKLARSSAVMLVVLGALLLLLGAGSWLAINAAIAAGIYELTGNVFYGVGGAALVNLAGVALVLWRMRACARDLGLPRTRQLLTQIGHAQP